MRTGLKQPQQILKQHCLQHPKFKEDRSKQTPQAISRWLDNRIYRKLAPWRLVIWLSSSSNNKIFCFMEANVAASGQQKAAAAHVVLEHNYATHVTV